MRTDVTPQRVSKKTNIRGGGPGGPASPLSLGLCNWRAWLLPGRDGVPISITF